MGVNVSVVQYAALDAVLDVGDVGEDAEEDGSGAGPFEKFGELCEDSGKLLNSVYLILSIIVLKRRIGLRRNYN